MATYCSKRLCDWQGADDGMPNYERTKGIERQREGLSQWNGTFVCLPLEEYS
jgi:hypothetical protein